MDRAYRKMNHIFYFILIIDITIRLPICLHLTRAKSRETKQLTCQVIPLIEGYGFH